MQHVCDDEEKTTDRVREHSDLPASFVQTGQVLSSLAGDEPVAAKGQTSGALRERTTFLLTLSVDTES
jgi:hypothetical protein